MQKLNSLESLRGIAAVSVVFYHFRVGSSFDNDFVDNAWLMVDFFFVLSGFVMTLAYTKRLGNMSEYGVFVKKRFLRLYPLHLLVLLAFVGFELSKVAASKYLGYTTFAEPFSGDKSVGALTANFMLIHNLVLPSTSWNYPSWSISAEFAVYLVFATVCVVFANRTKVQAIVFAFLMFFAFGVLQYEGMKGQMNIAGPSRCVFSFILGHFTYLLLQKKSDQNLSFLGLALFAASIFTVASLGHFPSWLVPFVPVLFAGTIYCVVRSSDSSRFIRILSWKPLVFLGTISYGIYMWHAFVIYLINLFVRKVFSYPLLETEEGVIVVVWPSKTDANIAALILLASSVGLAWVSFRFFETRFYRSASQTSRETTKPTVSG